MCTAVFYRDLMAEQALEGVHLVAATLPGHGGTIPPRDLRVENYARLASELAVDLGADVVVGHSMGAFAGPLCGIWMAMAPSRHDSAIPACEPGWSTERPATAD
jgi:pimeloyl-ACP methyl ester carboxylesterase